MNITELIFYLLGGLGFFFFGMQLMSDGLKKISGEKLKSFLNSATKIPLIGILVGAMVSCLLQSSSATTVMVVGFVNAGLLNLQQAVSIVIGANIGTTITAWLVSFISVFNITKYALPAIGIGFIISKSAKTKKTKSLGQSIMGFGILFTGLSFMKDAFEPLNHSQYLKDIIIWLSDYPIMGVVVGIVFTILLQSSSATITLVQILAFNGIISFQAAIPIILGDNIGTTITAQVAALNTNVNAKRTAMSHSLFNVIGVLYMLIIIYTGLFDKVIGYFFADKISPRNIMFYIALSHTFFNVFNSIIFLPFIEWLTKISILLVPAKKEEELMNTSLEKHILATPAIAIEQIIRETANMLSIAKMSVSSAVDSFLDIDIDKVKKVLKFEEIINNRQSEITQYIIELSQKNIADNEYAELPVLIHNVNDIERIGDHAQNISELTEKLIDDKLKFSPKTIELLKEMWIVMLKMIDESEVMLKTGEVFSAKKVLVYENQIDRYQIELKELHIERLKKYESDLRLWLIFIGFVDNLEKIGDHLSNIAQGIIKGMTWKLYNVIA